MELSLLDSASSQPLFLSPKQVAKRLGLSMTTVYRMIESRLITHYKIGGAIKIAPKDIEIFVQKQRVEAHKPPEQQYGRPNKR